MRSAVFSQNHLLRNVSVTLIALCLLPAGMRANHIQPHVSLNVGSEHIGANRTFEEVNPGIGIGFSTVPGPSGWSHGAELGFYRNSHGNTSAYAIGTLEREVFRSGRDTRLLLGAKAGVARYPEAAESLARRGLPTIDDWVGVVGITSALKFPGGSKLRVGVLPGPGVADAVVTFQFRLPLFGPEKDTPGKANPAKPSIIAKRGRHPRDPAPIPVEHHKSATV